MKALKLLIIIVLCALRISVLQAQHGFYHYKEKNAFTRDSTRSIIEFRNDTVFLMNFPDFMKLEYSIGKYKVNQDSTVIECEMYKNIIFSLNTGMVSWYTKDCHTIVKLGISKENELTRVPSIEESTFYPKEHDSVPDNLTMRYTKFGSENYLFPFAQDIHRRLDHYDDPKTLKACDWLENRK